MPWPDSKNNYKNQNSDTHKNKKEEAMEIRTSAPDCFSHMAQAYKNKDNFFVTDDARTGINPAYSTLLDMGKQAGLAPRQWIGVLSSLGLAGAGLWLARAAVLDPEPTSKLLPAPLWRSGLSCGWRTLGHQNPDRADSPKRQRQFAGI